MKLQDIFLTASGNMLRNKMRTALTIMAIFVGAFTLTLTNGLGAGISSYVDKQLDNFGKKDTLLITVKNSAEGPFAKRDEPEKYVPGETNIFNFGPGMSRVAMTGKDLATLKNDSDLKDIEPSILVRPDYVQGPSGEKYKMSVSPFGGATKPDLAAGRQLAADSADGELILPISYAKPLGFGGAQDAVGKSVTIAATDALGQQSSVTALIAGIQQKGVIGSSNAIFNAALKNKLYALQSVGFPPEFMDKYISASARISGPLNERHIRAVKRSLGRMGYSAQTIEDQLGTFETVIRTIALVLDAFAVTALLAAGFGIVNTLLMSVQERTKEIGLMKAMGMRSGRIFLLFSLEAVLIGFWGSVLGIAAAVLVGGIANRIAAATLLKDLPDFSLLAFPFGSIAGIMLLIVVIAFLAGALPARRAAELSPIDALRYE